MPRKFGAERMESEPKSCVECGRNVELGRWSTIIDHRNQERDTSGMCEKCFDRCASIYSEQRGLDIKYPEGWVNCQLHNGPIGRNQVAYLPYISTVRDLSTECSEVSGLKAICFDCIQVQSAQDCDDYVAIENSVREQEYKIHINGVYVLLTGGAGFSIYKPHTNNRSINDFDEYRDMFSDYYTA